MKTRTSPLFSLGDSFEYQPTKINVFEELGEAPLGQYHIVVFFRNVVASRLMVDYKNPATPTNASTVYNIVNARGSIYGVLFVVGKDKFSLRGNKLLVRGRRKQVGDFALYPYNSERLSVMLYRDSSDTLLVNIGSVESKFVVADDEVGNGR